MYPENLLDRVECWCEHVFCTLEYTFGYYEIYLRSFVLNCHKIATVTNCDNSGILAVAICDLSQFVIKAVTAQTKSNNTEDVFWVLGRVPRFTFDMNMKSCIFAHSDVISLVYLFVCMYISYKAHNRCTQEIFLTGSDIDVNMFSAHRNIPSGTIDINLKSCSFEPSQIATVTNCDTSGIPAVAICDWSQFVIKTAMWHIDSNNTENVFWVLGRIPRFTFDMNMKSCISAHFGIFSLVYLFVCISVIKSINDVVRKPHGNGPMCLWTCFMYFGIYPRLLLTSIWEVVFWTVTDCDSHKLRQIRNLYRHNLWFVAICDQDRTVANLVI